MPTLNVSEFSCLYNATFTLAPVNVIIGPQGSGKSVTTKLFYFFSDIPNVCLQLAERGDSITDFKKHIAKQFSLWFPPSAWGPGRFNLNYYGASFGVRILRRMTQGRVLDEVSITFSDWFTSFYKDAVELFANSADATDLSSDSNLLVIDALDRHSKLRDVLIRRYASEVGADYISQQTFIPAGRAFFTSIGRLVAAFEQAGSLDPVTIKFAKLFANLRDRNSRRSSILRISRLGEEFTQRRALFMRELFGGKIVYEDESEYVETEDGRKIPFASLSSGQQELLPMWSLVDYFTELDASRENLPNRSSRRFSDLIYIEEPEAHLFPSAQSLLMEFLIGSVASERSRRNLVITTHSPYIMSKLNVFLKAGQLARRKKRNQDIDDIVPRECWLTASQLSASAIEERGIRSLLDEDGLIDGRYLDQVSEDISNEFSQLLRLEAEM